MAQVVAAMQSGVRVAGVAMLLFVGLLLFVLLAVAMRPLLIVAAILAVIADLVLARFSPRSREWFEQIGHPTARG